MNTDKEINIFLEGKKIPITFYHPLTQMTEKIYEIFLRLGYSFFESSEIETEENNFNLLNMPRFHPARTMHDTFYLNDNLLLRTHTTNIQPYLMKKNINKELRVITMGKVYRRDNDDPSHTHQFMQFDCFVVEKETKFTHSFAHLKGTIEFFIKEIFRKKKIRFRPSYFPFTEPSVELDIECICLKNKKCNICKGTK